MFNSIGSYLKTLVRKETKGLVRLIGHYQSVSLYTAKAHIVDQIGSSAFFDVVVGLADLHTAAKNAGFNIEGFRYQERILTLCGAKGKTGSVFVQPFDADDPDYEVLHTGISTEGFKRMFVTTRAFVDFAVRCLKCGAEKEDNASRYAIEDLYIRFLITGEPPYNTVYVGATTGKIALQKSERCSYAPLFTSQVEEDFVQNVVNGRLDPVTCCFDPAEYSEDKGNTAWFALPKELVYAADAMKNHVYSWYLKRVGTVDTWGLQCESADVIETVCKSHAPMQRFIGLEPRPNRIVTTVGFLKQLPKKSPLNKPKIPVITLDSTVGDGDVVAFLTDNLDGKTVMDPNTIRIHDESNRIECPNKVRLNPEYFHRILSWFDPGVVYIDYKDHNCDMAIYQSEDCVAKIMPLKFEEVKEEPAETEETEG